MIKNLVSLFAKFYLFWLVFFAANRLVFLGLYRSHWQDFDTTEVLGSLTAGLRLDLSVISYFAILLILLFLFQSVLSKIWRRSFSSKKLFTIYTLTLVVLSAFIDAGEAGLYSEWGAKLNAKALSHIVDPSEVIGTVSTYHIFLFVVIGGFQILFFSWLFKRWFLHRPYFDTPRLPQKMRLIGLGLILLPMLYLLRGGLQPIPINISDANYSQHIILNDVAINSDWNLVHSIRENRLNMLENPYQFMPDEEAQKIAYSLMKVQEDAYPKIIDQENPNVVLLIMESWSADIIEKLDGYPGLTPFFDEISDDGYLFTNLYANGWTSDQGICALLSASPVFPHSSVINQSDKSRKISSINQVLADQGYSSSFHFGGQLSYGNIKAYLLNQNFGMLKEQKDLPQIPSGRLGIHDEYMYDVFAQDLHQMKPPFFSALFTVSTHSPYDIPREVTIPFDGEHAAYLRSAKYSDACMRDFFEKVKSEPWYDHTIFVIVADHSHKTSKEHSGKDAALDHKIPLLFYGPALTDSLAGTTNNTLGSQLDLAKTLLYAMRKNTQSFPWSKNLMDKNLDSFAPYVFHYGIGMLDDGGGYSYMQDRKMKRYSWGITPDVENRIQKECEAYFQTTNNEFMDL